MAQTGEATTFLLRNHAPFTAIIGMPARWPDGTAHLSELVWNVSNHSMSGVGNDTEILQDGETHTLTARVQYPVATWLRVGIELPWISHSGGFLDGTIDTWHEWFNLPEGIRPQVRNDQLNYIIQRNGGESYRLSDSTSGIGDIRLAATVELGSWTELMNSNASASSRYLSRIPWHLSFTTKLPTGEADNLTGSGSTDVALGVGWRAPRTSDSAVNWWLDLGLLWPGNVDLPVLDEAGQIFYYDAALTWRVLRRLDVIVQIAGHSAAYQGDLSSLSRPAAQIALGGLWHFTPGAGVRLGLFEDLRSASAPDFGLELALIFGRWK